MKHELVVNEMKLHVALRFALPDVHVVIGNGSLDIGR